jgi:stage II sporulation protein P
MLNLISKLKITKINPEELIKNTTNIEKKNLKEETKKITNGILKIDINRPITILKKTMYYTPNKEYKKYYSGNKMKKEPDKTEINNEDKLPEVYIYNTHQTEEYAEKYTVFNASNYLKEQLEKLGVKTIVEESNISEILNNNNWKYQDSYKASRINLKKIIKENPSIKIFIDLHRDSVKKNSSTTTINDKEYAKILFVIGKEHENYQKNLEYTDSINNIILKKYPQLTKGILQKEGKGVNGIYNQDLKTNIILMEVGAHENTKEEVINTLDIMATIIKEKINEE